ncbi:patatin-like phospholipase family protein [Paucibacter sp. TC2R-5]|uniref:patatin-like phospholipase family protein n=1 Tax=Paucibacter sp. TC2R-5 TaxID=2893555 RepID=UPI0021E44EFF|nr:patatin-like phospholipase family protein [Paucibacter sp. TC2R-5]MCV2358937.1 patatin-like phospholipase family protein [Paucibacter sp. TC2R-5]
MTNTSRTPSQQPGEVGEVGESILVLQGGGALGAYQAGVYEALQQCEAELSWVAGISIGAINAALIAGNPAELRVPRLREFWDLLSSALPVPGFVGQAIAKARENLNEASATQVMMFGVPGFFRPRFPPAPWQAPGSLAAISYYDTTPLRATLERLVDFDRINDGPMRLSVGAVNVRSGNFAYFDSHQQRLDARHIMASGALPPGFAPVEIDGEHYWDGGLVSNTPLQYVLDQAASGPRTVFQVDLFSARGAYPANLGEVTEREKDIRFSSRTRLNTSMELDRQLIAQTARRLIAKLPAHLQADPDVRALADLRCDGSVDVVHLIYRSKHYETQSKDFEFSRLSMKEHWEAGLADMNSTLHSPRWLARERSEHGVHVYDLTAEAAGEKKAEPQPVPATARR